MIKNIGYSGIQSFLGFLLPFFSNIFIARLLKPQYMGAYSFFVWLVSLSSVVVLMGLPQTIIKYTSQLYNQNNKILSEILNSYLKNIIVLFFIYILIIVFFYVDKINLSLFVISLFLYVFNTLLASGLHGVKDFKSLAVSSVLNNLLMLIGVLSFLKYFPSIENMIYIYLFSLFVSMLLNFYNFKKYFIYSNRFVDESGIKSYYKTVSVMIILDYIIWQNSEIFFLKIFSSSKEIAFYALGFSLSFMPSTLIGGSINKVILPFMSEFYGTKDKNKMENLYYVSTKYLIIFLLPIYIFLMFFSDILVKLIYGLDYMKASNVIKIISVSAFIGAISSPGSSYFHASEKQKILLKIGFFVAFVNILSNIFLIPKYHSLGAALGNSLSQIIGCIMGTGYAVYKLKLRFPYGFLLKYMTWCTFIGFIFYKYFLSPNMGVVALLSLSFFYFLISLSICFFDEENKAYFKMIYNKIMNI